jgi:signal transduction histidine kinase/CheY-like chemotaxis protein
VVTKLDQASDYDDQTAPRTVEISGGARRARLIAVAGGELGRAYTIGGEGVVIGRDPQASIMIASKDVSRQHAQIIRLAGAHWMIKDLDSANGTQVNGVAVKSNVLQFGDRIQIGESAMFVFARQDDLGEKVLELQKMEAIGQLAGGVAHDFNNLIAAINSNLAYLVEEIRCEDFDREEALQALAEARTATERASEVTRQLLSFSRRVEHTECRVDLSELTTEVVQLSRRTFSDAIEIEANVGIDVAVVADRTQLHQVLMNLCINARDAMPDGGKLTIHVHQGQLPSTGAATALLVPSGQCVILSVSDTGVGMDAKTRERIFEPFFTTKSDKGTGLGLATCYSIVKRHGGDIEVQSSPDGGATFKVLLPAADPPPATQGRTSCQPALSVAGTPPPVPAQQEQKPCVLLVDDDGALLAGNRRLLKRMGYEVFCATDGREALAIYEQHRDRIGVVLLDMVMPILGGRDTFRVLRTVDPGARVLLTSGQVDSISVSDLLDSGAEGFLPKPLDEEALRQTLDRVFGQR